MTASMTGTYIFISDSTMDTYGYFYNDSFDPFYPTRNLIASNDDSNSAGQFLINVILQFERRYILVVTTYTARVKGRFLIKAVGPTSLNLTSINQIISE
jgi:hypothetical protein